MYTRYGCGAYVLSLGQAGSATIHKGWNLLQWYFYPTFYYHNHSYFLFVYVIHSFENKRNVFIFVRAKFLKSIYVCYTPHIVYRINYWHQPAQREEFCS